MHSAADGRSCSPASSRPTTSIVSPQIAGQIAQLLVKEGDTVKKDQLVAVIAPDELRADSAYYAHNAEGLASQVRESEAALRFQERQTADQIRQAEATLALDRGAGEAADGRPRERAAHLRRARRTSSQQGVVLAAGARSGARRRTTAAQAQARLR